MWMNEDRSGTPDKAKIPVLTGVRASSLTLCFSRRNGGLLS